MGLFCLGFLFCLFVFLYSGGLGFLGLFLLVCAGGFFGVVFSLVFADFLFVWFGVWGLFNS